MAENKKKFIYKDDYCFWILAIWCFSLLLTLFFLASDMDKLTLENAELLETQEAQETELQQLSSDNANYERLLEIILAQGALKGKELETCNAQLEACLSRIPALHIQTMSW